MIDKSQDSLPLIRRLWREYICLHRARISFASIALITVAGLSAVQAYLIGPAVDKGIMGQDYGYILILSGVIILLGFLKGSASYAQAYLLSYVGSKLIASMQKNMMRAAIHADLPQIHGQGSSRFVARFLSDSYLVRDATVKSLIGIAKDFLTVLGMIGLMFYTSWEMSLAVFLVFPLSVVPILWIGKKIA